MADVLVPAILNSVSAWDGYEPAAGSTKDAGNVLNKIENLDEERAEEYNWRDVRAALLHLEDKDLIETKEVFGEEKFNFHKINRRELVEYHREVIPSYQRSTLFDQDYPRDASVEDAIYQGELPDRLK